METPAPLAQDYIKAKQAKGAADVLSRLEKRLTPPAPAGQSAKPPAAGPQKPQGAQQAAGATSATSRVSLASTAGGMAGAAVKDVVQGTIETVSGRSLLYGVGKAADEMMDTLGGVIGLDFDKAEEWVERVTGLPISDKHMEELAPSSTTGKLTAGVAQFIAGMAPVAKAMQGVGLAAQLGRTGTSVVAGAIGDAAAFDEHAERLSNLVQSVPGLSNPVTGYLAAEEDDTVLEGKIKQLLEGAGVGAAAEAVMGGIRVIKRWRDARAAMPEAEAQAAVKKAEREVAAGVDAASDEALGLTPRDWMTLGGAPEDDLFTVGARAEAIADDVIRPGLFDPGPGDKVGNINLSRLQSEEDVRAVIQRTATMMEPELVTRRQSTDIAREMADELLTDPEKLRTMMSGQSAAGRAFTREEIIATGSLLAQNGQAISNLAKKIVGGAATDVEKLALKRAMAFQETLLRTVSGQAREAGRALQAFQTQVTGSGMSARAIRDLLADGVPAERLASVVSKLSPREINAAAKGGWWKNAGDALFESWMGSKLLSPWTHARNVVGNSLTLFTSIPERALAARLSAKGTGVEPGEAAEMAYAAISGFRDALRAAGSAFKSGLPSDLDAAVKGEIKAGGSPHRRAITAAKLGLDESSPLGKAVDFYGSWITGTAFRGLVAEDEFFKSIARRMQLHAVAYRTAHREGLTSPESMSARMAELIAEPPPWLWDEAVSFGRHVTFQDPMKEVGVAVAKIRASTPFGRYVMPFLQTPANIFKYAMARTPLAPIMPSWRADLAAGGARRDLALAKVSMGSLVMATAADWVAQGHITGGRPSDPQEAAAWDRQGRLPYAAKIGERWVQYNQLEPLGLTMGVAADVAQLLDLADDVKGLAADPAALDRAYQKLIKAGMTPEEASRATQRAEEQMSEGFTALPGVVVSSLAYNLLEKSYLSGLSDLADVIFAPSAEARTQAASRYVQDFATGFVPLDAPIRWAERMVDPELREAKGIVEALKVMTPGFSSGFTLGPITVEPSVVLPNLWGEARRSAVAYSPFGTLPPSASPIDQALEKVGYFPSMPQKSIQGVRLTPEQYVEYVRLAGNELKGPGGLGAKDTLDAIVAGKHAMSKAWERGSDGPDGGKAHVVRTVVEGFREVARIEMLRRHPELRIFAEEGKAVKAQGRATLAGPPQIR